MCLRFRLALGLEGYDKNLGFAEAFYLQLHVTLWKSKRNNCSHSHYSSYKQTFPHTLVLHNRHIWRVSEECTDKTQKNNCMLCVGNIWHKLAHA